MSSSSRTLVLPGTVASPVDAFRRLAGRRGVFWCDSSLARPGDGRFSIMGCEPRSLFTVRGDVWHWEQAGGLTTEGRGQPLAKLDELVDRFRAEPTGEHDLPFWGGAIGWFSYDLGRQFETFGGTASEDLPVPDIRLAWHDAAIIWDHQTGRSWLVGVGWDRTPEAAIDELGAWLREPPALPGNSAVPALATFASDLSRDDYLTRVSAARDCIARGEIYQMNLVQRFAGPHRESPAATYLRLRQLNPAPFAFFQDAGALAAAAGAAAVSLGVAAAVSVASALGVSLLPPQPATSSPSPSAAASLSEFMGRFSEK